MGVDSSGLCAVAASPQLRERLRAAAVQARRAGGLPEDGPASLLREPRRLGFNDGVLRPPSAFPPGTDRARMRAAAVERGPLRGAVRVVVVLVDFPDRPFGVDPSRFADLFFSTRSVPTGSVHEYFLDATHGLVEITGEVVGPLRMPQPSSWYANGNYGIGNPSGEARAPFLAQDAVRAADAVVDLTPYDNDGDGYVDAFVVVHAGRGGEETGDPADLWSHKWVLPQEHVGDATRVFAYLTVPEDARLGVSAHELGHLLFGFPDLYDTDGTSEGVGSWCLMGGGSWNGGGDVPAQPSAWCKATQGWVQVENVTADGTVTLADVKSGGAVHRLWTGGQHGPEYFLLENRQATGYDTELPGGGLLVWHVDERQADNADEDHPLVGLVQADGLRQLEQAVNRGDDGDCFPGAHGARLLSSATTPSSQSHAGQDTGVVVADISNAGEEMTAVVSVTGGAAPPDERDETATDLAQLMRAVEQLQARLEAVTSAVSAAGSALSAAADGSSAWSPRSTT